MSRIVLDRVMYAQKDAPLRYLISSSLRVVPTTIAKRVRVNQLYKRTGKVFSANIYARKRTKTHKYVCVHAHRRYIYMLVVLFFENILAWKIHYNFKYYRYKKKTKYNLLHLPRKILKIIFLKKTLLPIIYNTCVIPKEPYSFGITTDRQRKRTCFSRRNIKHLIDPFSVLWSRPWFIY